MPKEVNPQDTTRAAAYELWMKAPNPMVTFFKTLDVTRLVRFSRKRNMKFNMGTLQKGMDEVLSAGVFSISSYADGRRTCRSLS